MLVRGGHAVTRYRLADAMRAAGQTVSNAHAALLVKVTKAEVDE
jgi:hypothetical protein